MYFAARTDFGPQDSAYGNALEQARARGGLIDLTLSNPTRCGFDYPQDLLRPLLDAQALRYDPDPIGMRSARETLSRMYREQYADIPPENVLLTASTSEAYSYLLRLFCEPGDAILVPSPSYPLFHLLAQLHDVEVITYPLVYHDGWQIDPASFRAAITSRTRVIVAIHPNNPTGHYCCAQDRRLLLDCARERNLPLVVDEVFLEYPVEGEGSASFVKEPKTQGLDQGRVLTFVLGGLSKLLCLPQMKLAWTIVSGPSTDVAEVMQRLEVIADTFLSVAGPPQLAVGTWLSHAEYIRHQVLQRVQKNLSWLDSTIAGTSVSRLKVEGGWSVVLRVPANDEDVDLAVQLLRERSVAVHPGSFYGFNSRGWLVASLIAPEETFRRGLLALLAVV